MSTLCPTTLSRLKAMAPQCVAEIERLSELTEAAAPVVTVLGKYNHGKSSLLNALIGEDYFAVSDHRETRRAAVRLHEGIQWMDTPGLHADVERHDDQRAMQAARNQADVRLFVHALDLGELDASELDLLRDLLAEQATTGRPTLLVLTRIANRSAAERDQVTGAVARQVPAAQIVAVSADSHRRGAAQGKPALVRLGNLAALRASIERAVREARQVRQRERHLLVSAITARIEQARARADSRYAQAQAQAHAAREALAHQLAQLQHRIAVDIRG